ncbi:MAG TPA: DNA recombination/repair protein RecA, partial [Azospirillum sp.]|nr:DNA recombination/repair protein RecA [Azospirillum sp.]
DIMYGEGVSKVGELLDLGIQAGVVEKSGAWFSYDGTRIGQGRENAKTYLRNNPDMAKSIEDKIRSNAGLVADAMMGTPESDADAATPE